MHEQAAGDPTDDGEQSHAGRDRITEDGRQEFGGSLKRRRLFLVIGMQLGDRVDCLSDMIRR
jgi:hypothetical protein